VRPRPGEDAAPAMARSPARPAESCDVRHINTKEEEEFFFFYSPDMWTLDVIDMIRNLEVYQTLY
jgi:hypothetical protein